MRSKISWMPLVVLIVAVIAICGIGTSAHAAGGDSHLQPGAPASNFSLLSQEEKPVALSDYKGKWVVLYFLPQGHVVGLHH